MVREKLRVSVGVIYISMFRELLANERALLLRVLGIDSARSTGELYHCALPL